MSITGNGTSTFVKTSAAISPLAAYSYHFHYQNGTAPGTAAVRRVITISDAASNIDITFVWHHTSSPQSAFHKRASTSYDAAPIPNTLLANTWYRIGVSHDGSSLRVYLNGTLVATVASAPSTNSANPTPSALSGQAATGDFDNGTIAEIGIWSVALSANDFSILGNGIAPSMVQPQNLLHYWPLVRDIVPVVGPAITSTAVTVANHSPVIYPDYEDQLRLTANATYLVTEAGGITIGDATTTTMAYTVTETGGIVIGALSVVMSDASFSTSLVMTQAESDEPYLRNNLELDSSFSPGDQFVALNSGISFRQSFAADTGELANGRNRGIANNSRGIAND